LIKILTGTEGQNWDWQ